MNHTHFLTTVARPFAACFAGILLAACLGGCGTPEDNEEAWWDWAGVSDASYDSERTPREKIVMPVGIRGTVAEYCDLMSFTAPISNWGVVIGLDKSGSSEVPPELRNDLIKYVRGELVISKHRLNKGYVSASGFLDDKDTAIVQVSAQIPPGAPKGTPVDVFVSAWPRTQTTSLQGGVLLPTQLQWDKEAPRSGRYLRPLGDAVGDIFVNPFLDTAKPGKKAGHRQGRILGGATIIEDTPIRLYLRDPDYHMAALLQRRINERFPTAGRIKPAKAKGRFLLHVIIPPEYRNDYKHFLALMMALPRYSSSGAYARMANEIAHAMEDPSANYEQLAMVWEAMGREILPTVQGLYASQSPGVSYYAARVGLRLGDSRLASPIVLRFAQTAKSPFQLPAIRELGRHPRLFEALPILQDLLAGRSELIRIAAYESLVKRGDFSAIQRIRLDEGPYGESEPAFIADFVDSSGGFVIYATRTEKPKMVLFGKDMPLTNPLFFEDKNIGISIFSRKGDPTSPEEIRRKDHLVVYRALPRTDEISPKYRIPFLVSDLIRVLGGAPRPDMKTAEVPGLGLTYGQVVSVLSRLAKQEGIRTKFVLQPLEEMRRIYDWSPNEGRPDMAEDRRDR